MLSWQTRDWADGLPCKDRFPGYMMIPAYTEGLLNVSTSQRHDQTCERWKVVLFVLARDIDSSGGCAGCWGCMGCLG
jgi:hypothetical protein